MNYFVTPFYWKKKHLSIYKITNAVYIRQAVARDFVRVVLENIQTI